MMRIETESGSVYEADTENRRIRRVPGAGASQLVYDEEWHYYAFLSVAKGQQMYYGWTTPGGADKVRTSTLVTAVEDV